MTRELITTNRHMFGYLEDRDYIPKELRTNDRVPN